MCVVYSVTVHKIDMNISSEWYLKSFIILLLQQGKASLVKAGSLYPCGSYSPGIIMP